MEDAVLRVRERLAAQSQTLMRENDELAQHSQWLRDQSSTPQLRSPVAMRSASPPGGNRGRVASPGGGSPALTRKARDIQRGEKVEEFLIRKGREYRQKREEARIEEISRREAEATGKPNVKHHGGNSGPGDVSVTDRLYRHNEKRLAEVETKRSQREQESESKETSELRAKPKISKMAQSIKRNEDVSKMLYSYHEQNMKQREELVKKMEQEELAKLRGSPEILERSRRLAEKKREKKAIGEHLYGLHSEHQRKIKDLAERQFTETYTGNPRITRLAAALPRGGDVGERLYNHRLTEEEHRLQELQEYEREVTPFTPKINRPSGFSNLRSLNIEDDLLERAREKELARKAKLEQELAVEEMQHHPSINPHSNEISARLPTTSADRLYKAPFSAEKTGQRPKSAQSPSAQDMTFKPQINPVSREIERGRRTPRTDRNLALYELSKKKKLVDITERTLEEEEKAVTECTFRPKISKYRGLSRGSSVDIAIRSDMWAKNRDIRIQAEAASKAAEEMKECTFTPRISKGSPTSRSGTPHSGLSARVDTPQMLQSGVPDEAAGWSFDMQSQSSVASVTEFSGVSEFLARQEAARRRKEEKEKALDFRPDNWKPKKTKPEAPKLGREGLEQRRSESVSLYRTSSPPVASMISQMVRSMDMQDGGESPYMGHSSFHRSDLSTEGSQSFEANVGASPFAGSQGIVSPRSGAAIQAEYDRRRAEKHRREEAERTYWQQADGIHPQDADFPEEGVM